MPFATSELDAPPWRLMECSCVLAVDMIILIIFIAEAVIKIMAESPKPWRYFRDAWNIMDFSIACVGLIDMMMSLSGAEAVCDDRFLPCLLNLSSPPPLTENLS